MSKATKYRFKASWGDRNVGDMADPQSPTFEFLKANGIVEELAGDKPVEAVKDAPVAEVAEAVEEAPKAKEATKTPEQPEQPAEPAPSAPTDAPADSDTKPKTRRKAK